MELKNFRSLQPYPVNRILLLWLLPIPPPPPPPYLYPPQFLSAWLDKHAACCESGPRGSLVAGSLWGMIGLSFIMKCPCPHSCLGSVYSRQLLFLNFSVGRTIFLHLDLKYADPPVLLMFSPPSPHFPASPMSTGLPVWRAHVGAHLKVCLVLWL